MTDEDKPARAHALAKAIVPLLMEEKDATVQGMVLANITSLWVLGHQSRHGPDDTTAYQRVTLEQFVELVIKLMERNKKLKEETLQ